MNVTSMATPPSAGPPAGWYADPSGAFRWWDGQRWGGVAPSSAESKESNRRLLAVLAQVSFLVLPLLPALVMRLLPVYRSDSFLRHHATEALNAQINMAVLWNGGFWVATSSHFPLAVAAPLVVIGVGSWPVLAVLCIRGGMRASRGEWWRYPVALRLIPGSRKRPSSQDYAQSGLAA